VTGILYGATPDGGGSCNCGTVFSYDLTANTETVLYGFPGGGTTGHGLGAFPSPHVTYFAGKLWGLTAGGGANDYDDGVIYNVVPGTGVAALVSTFHGSPDARGPGGGLVPHQGVLYGTSQGGGVGLSGGTLFKLNPTTDVRQAILNNGFATKSPLVFDGSSILVMTSRELDAVNPVTKTVTTLATLPNNGGSPVGPFAVASDAIYFTMGGSYGLYKYDRTGGQITQLFLKGLPSNLSYPLGVTMVNDTLYGAMEGGGSKTACNKRGCGFVYSFNTKSGVYKTLYEFTGGADGSYPNVPLVAYKHALYGATLAGGAHGFGTLYEVVP
jgi:uncharacterized repeat protein (TIGR03803 family)